MVTRLALRGAAGAALLAALAGCAAVGGNAFSVAEIGSFHIGGREVTLKGEPVREVRFVAGGLLTRVDPNGELQAEQMYVHYVRLAQPRARFPLLMWHGGGLSGVTWETKPDGAPGWQQYFLRAGHSVYVSDSMERGRSGWGRRSELFRAEPISRTKKEAWELFRIGPDGSYVDSGNRKAWPDTQFPVAAFDQFMMQGVPRWAGTDDLIVAAYGQLVQKTCPCVLMAHSQGGPFALRSALAAPDRVQALVLVEPSATTEFDTADLSALSGKPVLVVYGDRWQDSPRWMKTRASVNGIATRLQQAGARVEWLDLPARGIRGNTHMLMMDRNSDEVAALIQNWLERVGMMR